MIKNKKNYTTSKLFSISYRKDSESKIKEKTNNKTVNVNDNKTVKVNDNKTVKVDNKAVTLDNKAVTLDNKAVTLDNKTIKVYNKANKLIDIIDYDTQLLFNLDAVSSIKKDEKITIINNLISVDNRYYFQGIRRWWSNDNRIISANVIIKLINNVHDRIIILLNEDYESKILNKKLVKNSNISTIDEKVINGYLGIVIKQSLKDYPKNIIFEQIYKSLNQLDFTEES